MKVAHNRDSAVVSPEGQKPRRGFTTVELAVSLGIFLLVSTFVTLTIARSIGEGSRAKAERVAVEASNDAASVLASYTPAALQSASFTVPFACSGTQAGIDGTSCPKSDPNLRIAFAFQNAAGECPTVSPSGDLVAVGGSASAMSADSRIGLCSVATDSKGKVLYPISATKRSVNYTPGYTANTGTVRVSVDVDPSAPATGLPTNLLLVRASDPGQAISGAAGTAAISNGQALFTGLSASQCTSLDPCQVALSASASPATSGSWGLFGSSSRPGSEIVATAGQSTEVGVGLSPLGSVKVKLQTSKGASPAADRVCMSALSVSEGVSMRKCNSDTSSPDTISFASWQFQHAESNGTATTLATYPLQVGAQLKVSADAADGTCPGGSWTVSSGSWTKGPVCTSWTWGQPTITPSTAIASAAGAQVNASWGTQTPAYGMNEETAGWSSPRLKPGCATSGTCSPLVGVPEQYLCPEENCLATP